MEDTTKANKKRIMKDEETEKVLVSPLRDEHLYVRFVPHKTIYGANDPKHPLYGGMAETATRTFCVPRYSSTGEYVDVLTKNEKAFLEEIMNLESNALSVYKKVNNFWDSFTVTIPKQGIPLDLNSPEDYIKYKVLLANSDKIAPSLEVLQKTPKVTYQFVITHPKEESRLGSAKLDTKMQSYKEFAKIESDKDTLRVLVETLDARPYAENTDIAFLRTRIDEHITNDAGNFLRQVQDPMLHTKVLIRRAVELNVVSRRDNFYYLRNDGSPLSEPGTDPTMTNACKFLNMPSHQDVLYILESAVNNAK